MCGEILKSTIECDFCLVKMDETVSHKKAATSSLFSPSGATIRSDIAISHSETISATLTELLKTLTTVQPHI